MKMAITRDISTSDILMRITPDAFQRLSQDAYIAEMREAVKHFVSTDPGCQILINEMVKEAFKGIDLLAVVSEAINTKLKGVLQSDSDSSAIATNPKARS